MEFLLLLALAIGQCRGGSCAPAPTPMADPRIADSVNRGRNEILVNGYAYDARQPTNPLVVAEYDYGVRAIRINASHPYWRDRLKHAEAAYKSGWFSTPHPEHVLRHEYGHAELHKLVGPEIREMGLRPLPLPADRIAQAVGLYACTSPVEFHAEVFAGLKYGRTFPPDVLEAYAEIQKP